MATSEVVVDYVIFFPRFGKKKKKNGRLKTRKGDLHKRRVKKKKKKKKKRVKEPARLKI